MPRPADAALVRRPVLAIPPYLPGRSIAEVRRQTGARRVVKLASNENALGPSPRGLAAAGRALGECHRYPDDGARDLRAALGRHLGVTPGHLLIGNGADEAIALAVATFLNQGEEAVIPRPTFSAYEAVVRLMGGRPRFVPLRDWAVDLAAVRAAVTRRTKLVFVCNPNNPTGTLVGDRALRGFLRDLPGRIVVVLDEAYLDFADPADRPEALAYIRRGHPVIALRTFSKLYGLAGLRVGYALARPSLIAHMYRVKPPFNVSVPAQAAALAALGDEAFIRRAIATVRRERARLTRGLAALGLRVAPSQANFVFARLPVPSDPIAAALLRRGVIVRPGSVFGEPRGLRISVGTPRETDACLRALATCLREAGAGGGS
jgi:histidinol-phosphate aminotransferase